MRISSHHTFVLCFNLLESILNDADSFDLTEGQDVISKFIENLD